MKWAIRSGKGNPNNNLFLKKNVEIKGNKITLKTDEKSCAEVLQKAKYGIYKFKVKKPRFLPKGVILGMFLYENDKSEIDIEFGRWGRWFNKNLQFVNQEPFTLIRYWSFRKEIDVEIDYHEGLVFLKANKKEVAVFHNLRNPYIILNLWHHSKPSKTQVEIEYEFESH